MKTYTVALRDQFNQIEVQTDIIALDEKAAVIKALIKYNGDPMDAIVERYINELVQLSYEQFPIKLKHIGIEFSITEE